MPFHEMKRQPDRSKILEPSKEAGLAVVSVPPLDLFTKELAFWNARKNAADRAGDAVTRRIAEESARGLRMAASGRLAVELALERGVYDPYATGAWFVDTMLITAHTRLMREIDQLPTFKKLEVNFKPSVDVAVDFYQGDPYKSGIHARTEYVRKFLAVEPPAPHQTRYYEGEAIYLRATGAPADPTDVFPPDFEAFYGVPFEPDNYVSIVPRLKTEFWMPPQ